MKNPDTLTFCEESHRYEINGRPVVSVTKILADLIPGWKAADWYLQRGRWLTSEYLNKFYLSYDGLLSRRADGALIRLITPAGSDVTSAQERISSFGKLLVPVLPQFMQK